LGINPLHALTDTDK